MKGTICPLCNGSNIIKRGIQRTKFGSTQLFYCKDCRKKFTKREMSNKTYGPKIITSAITYYNLGNTLNESAKLTRRFKMDIQINSMGI